MDGFVGIPEKSLYFLNYINDLTRTLSHFIELPDSNPLAFLQCMRIQNLKSL